MNKTILLITLIQILLFFNVSKANEKFEKYSYKIDSYDRVYKLTKKWFFKTHDDINYKNIDVDLTDWNLLNVYFSWTNYPEFQNYKGNSWYRTHIIINNKIEESMGILIPWHYRGAQFYVNGVLIYESRPFDEKGNTPPIVGKPDMITIPAKLLNPGKNVIAIRTGVLSNMGGFGGSILFGSIKLINKIWIKSLLWYASLGAINLFVFIYFLLIYLNRKNDKYYLYLSLTGLFLGFWILGFKCLILWVLDYQWVYIISAFAGATASSIMTLKFLVSYLKFSKTYIYKTLLYIFSSLLVFIVFEFVLTESIKYSQKYFFNVFVLLNIFLVFYFLFLVTKGVRNKKPYSKQLLIGVLFFNLSFVFSSLFFLELINIEPFAVEGFVIMTIFFASALASRFAKVHTDLEKAHSDLIVLDKMKDQFMATTSHELRTPLHGIKGISDSLKDGSLGPVNEEQKYNLELVSSNANLLSKLVNDILDFSKIREKKADLFLEEIKIDELINSVVSMLKVIHESKNVNFIEEIEPVPAIVADKKRLNQILFNLLGNAVKFSEKNSSIKICLSYTRGEVLVSIEDTGPGIDEKIQPYIWHPFVQAEDATVRSHEGVGLGLAITKELVEMHGGKIWFESEPGKGSIFTFMLPEKTDIQGIPVSEMKEAPAEIETENNIFVENNNISLKNFSQKDKVPGKPIPKILAVDDDLTNLQVIKNICIPRGYDICTAKNGQEALEIMNEFSPDLVLLDLMMPGMSGYEVCEKIKSEENRDYMPVIMLTALDQLSDMLKGFQSGANDYLSKPFDKNELMVRIENHLKIKKMHHKERELNSTLNIYKNIVSSSQEHMAFVDKDYNFLAINDAFISAIVKEKEMTKIQNFQDLSVKKEYAENLRDHVEKALAGEEIHFERWNEYPVTGLRYMYTSLYPYLNESDEITGAVYNAMDITERVEVEKAAVDMSANERQRIGIELHDGLSHFLLNIAIRTSLLSKKISDRAPEGSVEAREIEKEINDAIQNTRKIARGLFPVSFNKEGLDEIFERIKNDFKNFDDINLKINVNESSKLDDAMTKSQLFYIIQEAVTNALKHSQADTISISLEEKGKLWNLSIKDNGVGITNGESIASGIGIKIMQYRARMIDGSFDLKSEKGEGTEVLCKFKV